MTSPEMDFSESAELPSPVVKFTGRKDLSHIGRGRRKGKRVEAEKKMVAERFGTPKLQRVRNSNAREFLRELEKSQFHRALAHLDEGTESDVDLRYVLKNAGKYLGSLDEEEYRERLQRLRDGNYTNADAVRVSAHYFSAGNDMGGQAIRRFVYEEKQPLVELSQGLPSGSLDAVDLAIQASEEGVSETA